MMAKKRFSGLSVIQLCIENKLEELHFKYRGIIICMLCLFCFIFTDHSRTHRTHYVIIIILLVSSSRP